MEADFFGYERHVLQCNVLLFNLIKQLFLSSLVAQRSACVYFRKSLKNVPIALRPQRLYLAHRESALYIFKPEDYKHAR
jgi:hypothetical protein